MNRSDRLGIAVNCLIAGVGFVAGGTKLGFALLTVGSVVLATLAWTRDKPIDKGHSALSWIDLEARMKELQLRDRINARERHDGPMDVTQTPDALGRQSWWLLGSTEALREEAKRLFAIAGAKLNSSGLVLSPRVAQEKDDFSRWVWFLVEIGKHQKHMVGTSYSKEQGSVQRHTYWLQEVLNDSIAGCVECLKREASVQSTQAGRP